MYHIHIKLNLEARWFIYQRELLSLLLCSVKKIFHFSSLVAINISCVKHLNYVKIEVAYVTCRSSCQEVFCKKDALKKFAKVAGKHLCWNLFFNKIEDLMLDDCFSVNLAKFLIKSFFAKHLRWLLPNMQAQV